MIAKVFIELKEGGYYEGSVLSKTEDTYTQICVVTGPTVLGVMDQIGNAIAMDESMRRS